MGLLQAQAEALLEAGDRIRESPLPGFNFFGVEDPADIETLLRGREVLEIVPGAPALKEDGRELLGKVQPGAIRGSGAVGSGAERLYQIRR